MMRAAVLVLLPSMVAPSCHDSTSWFKTGETHKTCEWVYGKPDTRCAAKGGDYYAFEVCGTACGHCGMECVDSATWHVVGAPSQDCAWAAGSTNRCAQEGEDGTRGYESCRMSCETCDEEMHADDAAVDDEGVGGSNETIDASGFTVSYQGVRDACLEENPDASHCPDEHPQYPEASDATPTCPLAIVGAGVGGLYMAKRLVEAGVIEASDVCIFEATGRVGGRTFSLRYGDLDLVVDSGAYRTWPEFTPVTHALITDTLGINMTCYDPAEIPCEKFIITNETTGDNLGFTYYLEVMAEELISAGAHWYPWHFCSKVSPTTDGGLELEFWTSTVATIPSRSAANGVPGGGLILNIPQRPLLEIFRASADDLSLDESIFEAAHAVQTAIVTKLYLYYEYAWWRALGLTSGDFEWLGDANAMTLKGRYHDGDVNCDENGENCAGFLLATYANDYSGAYAQYFRRYQRDRPEPVTIISDSTVEGRVFLAHAHERLTDFHIYENSPAPYPAFQAQRELEASGPPKFAVMATWNIATLGAGGGWHGFTNEDLVDAMPSALADEYGIHIVNEAYSRVQSWAEGSLQVADSTLEQYYGLGRPWDFPASDVPLHLAQTAPFACAEDEDGDSSSGDDGDSTGGGGGGAVVDDELACFLGSARVTLADGSTLALRDVEKGAEIMTGFGTGIVSEVLVHPVGAEVDVVVFDAPYGEVVGTRTHPVFIDGEWREAADALEARLLDGKMRHETRYVDAFYNLEVDGGEHAYLLNDLVIASGLGDNVDLNMRFPRQNVWKARAATTSTN